jgi:hypothetical protein
LSNLVLVDFIKQTKPLANIVMSNISDTEKIHFHEKGWVLVPLPLRSDQIKRFFVAASSMRSNAILNKYAPGTVEFDHLNKFNLAAIECPFNHKICPKEIQDMFTEICLGSMVRNLMNWNDIYCSLARLFCMGNYKYRGNWHRDFEVNEKNPPSYSVLANIFLDNQKGLRYLKKEYDLGGSKSLIPNASASSQIQQYWFPLSPPRSSYDVLGGYGGSVLFFDPYRYHQGSNNTSRLDFHMRFENAEQKPSERVLLKNSFQDFELHDYLHYDFDIDSPQSNSIIPLVERQPLKARLKTSLNYYTGILNPIKILRRRKLLTTSVLNFGFPDFSSNTIFQKTEK